MARFPLPGESDELDLLSRAAREAGDVAMSFFGKDPKIWWKENDSPVSEGDYAVDRHLTERLLSARPGYGWVSEESVIGADIREDPGIDRFFVVDPIDGTRAYLRGEDTWCVSIALIENGRPLAAAIWAPVPGEMFTATRSGATLLNGAPIEAAGRGEDSRTTVAMPDQFRAAFRRLGDARPRDVVAERGVPSLAYRLCLVAAGRIAATLIRPRAHDWDIAAGDLLLERAKAALVDANGHRLLYTRTAKRHGLLVAASNDQMKAMRCLAEAVSD